MKIFNHRKRQSVTKPQIDQAISELAKMEPAERLIVSFLALANSYRSGRLSAKEFADEALEVAKPHLGEPAR